LDLHVDSFSVLPFEKRFLKIALYMRGGSANKLPLMKLRRFGWFFAFLAVACALALSSCMDQEGVGPAEGELKGGPAGQN
jgi:hypothetical protein